MNHTETLKQKTALFLTLCNDAKGYPYQHKTFLSQMRNPEKSALTMGKEVIDYVTKNKLAFSCHAIVDGNDDHVSHLDYDLKETIYYFSLEGTKITDAGRKWLKEYSKK